MKSALKHLLQRVGCIMFTPPQAEDVRTSASTKAALTQIFLSLQARARAGLPLPRLCDSGLRVFSQFEEDGYLLHLAAVLEIEPKLFVDVGSADGINGNCANLALNLGWHGLFIDGNAESIRQGERFYASHRDTWLYPPRFRQALVTRENINHLIGDAGFHGPIGILSIDIDGNDYWVWEALEVVQPSVVIIETHVAFGLRNIVVPYDANYAYPGRHPSYHGASPIAMRRLARRKGYRLVGANRYGFNLIFVRQDLPESRAPEVPLETVLRHPRFAEGLSLFTEIEAFPYVTPDP